MKKVLTTLLVVTAIACNKTEIVEHNPDNAICFDRAFVDNATRAAYDGSYDNDNLEGFDVYAIIKNSNNEVANIFRGEEVVKGTSDEWTYDEANTQYWVPNNTYTFRAIADGNVSGATEVIANESDKYLASGVNLLDASKQKDILVAEETVNYVSGPHTVNFTFSHIMSKVKFTIKNTITTDSGYSYKVSNIAIEGIAKNGVYTFGSGWAPAVTPETYTLMFGNAVADGTMEGVTKPADIGFNGSVESNYDRLLIPTTGEQFKIKFDYELLKDDIVIDTQTKEIESGGLTLRPGHAYNFVIKMGNPGEPIKFSVEKVNGWDTDLNDNDVADDDIDIN
ncbi:MAG: fimbrillin family protein [Prevotella sp.]|nr:fimbrillin family protein [Prevotella sp.]